MQFDVFRNAKSPAYPLLLDLQAELLERLATRVVAPLTPRSKYATPLTRLTPCVTVADQEYVVVFPLVAVIPRTRLGAPIASLAPRRNDFIAALDLLFTGA